MNHPFHSPLSFFVSFVSFVANKSPVLPHPSIHHFPKSFAPMSFAFEPSNPRNLP